MLRAFFFVAALQNIERNQRLHRWRCCFPVTAGFRFSFYRRFFPHAMVAFRYRRVAEYMKTPLGFTHAMIVFRYRSVGKNVRRRGRRCAAAAATRSACELRRGRCEPSRHVPFCPLRRKHQNDFRLFPARTLGAKLNVAKSFGSQKDSSCEKM